MMIDKQEAFSMAEALALEFSKTSSNPVVMRIDYSIGPDKISGFQFAYSHRPFRLAFDFTDPRSTKYRLSDPQIHKIIEYTKVENFKPTRLHVKILEWIQRKEKK